MTRKIRRRRRPSSPRYTMEVQVARQLSTCPPVLINRIVRWQVSRR